MFHAAVREALQALEASVLLMVQPKCGTLGAKLGVGELMERLESMAGMESFCARLVCRRADADGHTGIAASLPAYKNAATAGDADR